RRSRLAALVAGSLGGLALIADLGRPERALNMMRTMKLTSPMSVGSWILMGFMGTTGAAVALDVATPMTRRTRAEGVARVGESLASAGSAFFAPPLAAYTAVLLSATATPTWHEAADELPFVFVGSATAAGAGLSLVTTPPAETMPARVLAAAGAALDLVADHRMGERLGMLAEPLETGLSGRLHRAAKVLTLAGGIGALVGGGRRPTAALSGLALMAGSVCTRLAVFHAGIASAKDPKYTIVPQRERAEAAARAGHGVTQPGEPAQDA
ncbi:MAG TPA: polysulfide reductase NrfD, partial [Actinomycetales bacterium]|nr:polysulfide reductase NrfD [Actinomycetales bacterium]